MLNTLASGKDGVRKRWRPEKMASGKDGVRHIIVFHKMHSRTFSFKLLRCYNSEPEI